MLRVDYLRTGVQLSPSPPFADFRTVRVVTKSLVNIKSYRLFALITVLCCIMGVSFKHI